MNLLITLFKLAFPLIKEYGISSLRLKKTNGRTLAILVGFLGVVWLTVLIGYLSEQATQNLVIHKPLIEQYNKLQEESIKRDLETNTIRTELYKCESAIKAIDKECSAEEDGKPEGESKPKVKGYYYDPDKKMMVLTD